MTHCMQISEDLQRGVKITYFEWLSIVTPELTVALVSLSSLAWGTHSSCLSRPTKERTVSCLPIGVTNLEWKMFWLIWGWMGTRMGRSGWVVINRERNMTYCSSPSPSPWIKTMGRVRGFLGSQPWGTRMKYLIENEYKSGMVWITAPYSRFLCLPNSTL